MLREASVPNIDLWQKLTTLLLLEIQGKVCLVCPKLVEITGNISLPILVSKKHQD